MISRGCVTSPTAAMALVPIVETIIVSAMLINAISTISSTDGTASRIKFR